METIQQQIVKPKKNECTIAVKEVKHLYNKEFVNTVNILKGLIVDGRKKNEF